MLLRFSETMLYYRFFVVTIFSRCTGKLVQFLVEFVETKSNTREAERSHMTTVALTSLSENAFKISHHWGIPKIPNEIY